MFNKTLVNTLNGTQIARAFIKSLDVQAFPCGRRRSALYNTQNDGSESYRIPFDPEARLNTEANNRKHSSLNGYTQTYLAWEDNKNKFYIAIAGYLFTISLTEYSNANEFGAGLMAAITDALKNLDENFVEEDFAETNTRIYANIVVKDTQLFSGFTNYDTEVLYSQYTEDTDTVLDLLKNENVDYIDASNYYFSGLSFSFTPLTAKNEIRSDLRLPDKDQTVFSLCILEKTESGWVACESAKLPKILHGDTPDSVYIGGELITDILNVANGIITNTFTVEASGNIDLTADAAAGHSGNINAAKLTQNGEQVPIIKVEEKEDDLYQLQIWINQAPPSSDI